MVKAIWSKAVDCCLAVKAITNVYQESERLRDDVDVAIIRYNRHAFDNDFDQIQLRSKK